VVVFHPLEDVAPRPMDRGTRWSLLGGVAGLVLLVVVTAADAMTRADGYDMTRHWISLLQHGGRGWLATFAFGATGLLLLGSVPGFRAAQADEASTSTAVAAIPPLVAALGLGLVALAIFPIDPSMEYPVPVDAYVVSTPGRVHSVAGAVVLGSFAALCWCIADASRRRPGTPGWVPMLARGSSVVIVGVFFGCSTIVVLSEAQSWEAARAGAFQRVALLLGGVWLSWYALELVSATLRRPTTGSAELEL